jgi:hypothetical protein
MAWLCSVCSEEKMIIWIPKIADVQLLIDLHVVWSVSVLSSPHEGQRQIEGFDALG